MKRQQFPMTHRNPKTGEQVHLIHIAWGRNGIEGDVAVYSHGAGSSVMASPLAYFQENFQEI
jgi:hypothetical protein